MATTLKMLAQAQVGTSLTTVYTVPGATNTLVKELIFCNTSTTSNVLVTVNFIKSGESASVANTIVKNLVLLPTETQFYGISSILPTGATIRVQADVDAVVGFNVSGMEVS